MGEHLLWIKQHLCFSDWLQWELSRDAAYKFGSASMEKRLEIMARMEREEGEFSPEGLSDFVLNKCVDIFRGEVDTMAEPCMGVSRSNWPFSHYKWEREGSFGIFLVKQAASLRDINWDTFSRYNRRILDRMPQPVLDMIWDELWAEHDFPGRGPVPVFMLGHSINSRCADIIDANGGWYEDENGGAL